MTRVIIFLMLLYIALVAISTISGGCSKTCQHHGKLDRKCNCECISPYTGEFCQTKQCPYAEPINCPKNHKKSDCQTYWIVPYWCPYYCGLCTESERPKCVKAGNCYRSPAGCAYIGQQASPAKCKTLGNHGTDDFMCSNLVEYKPDWTCEHCKKWYNIKQQYCPYMCGYCKSDCGDLFCQNGGVMDHKTCTCKCQKIFSGKDCSIKNCPHSVPDGCGQSTRTEHCTMYSQSKYWCPYICGVCKEEERMSCKDDPNCYTSKRGCQSNLDRYDDATCKKKGANGVDFDGSCTNQGNGWKCADCKFTNVEADCPFMCGKCGGV